MNTFLVISFIILILINNLIDALKIKIVLVNDMPVEDCDGYPPETKIHKFFDISDLKIERTDEDVMTVNGDIIYKGGLNDPDNLTEAKALFFINKFDKWIPIPYSSFVEDICKAAFGPNPDKMWENAIKKVKGKKLCPFEAGDKFGLNQTVLDECYDVAIMRSANDFDGLYKSVTTLKYNNEKKPALLCIQTIFRVENC